MWLIRFVVVSLPATSSSLAKETLSSRLNPEVAIWVSTSLLGFAALKRPPPGLGRVGEPYSPGPGIMDAR